MDQPVKPANSGDRFTLDDVTYALTLAAAEPAWDMLMTVGPMLQDLSLTVGADNKIHEWPVGRILQGLGSPEFRELRVFLLKHTAAQRAGAQPFRLEDEGARAAHFNKYRSHFVPLLARGFMFQFSDFFAGGALAQMLPVKVRDTLKAQFAGSSSNP